MPVIEPELLAIVAEAKRKYSAESDGKEFGIRDWLIRGGTYFIAHCAADRLVVECVDDSWANANGSDITRYFHAARESILPRATGAYDARSIGWSAVTIYYSGLYLCLGLLRCFGYGLMYLTSDDCNSISQAFGNAAKLDSGTYSLTVTLGARPKIELSKKRAKGFHEAFWRHADDCLKLVEADTASGVGAARPFPQQARTAALLSLGVLRSYLGQAGVAGRDIGWMSTLRNDINYRLARNIWSPNYRHNGVSAARLKQDILAIIRGDKERLGVQLQLDRDVRSMIERVVTLYRDLSDLETFPPNP